MPCRVLVLVWRLGRLLRVSDRKGEAREVEKNAVKVWLYFEVNSSVQTVLGAMINALSRCLAVLRMPRTTTYGERILGKQ